jgi:hypothetical protein
VLRRHRDKWTTVAAHEKTPVVLFELSESYVRIEHAEDILAVDLVARRGDTKVHREVLAPIACAGSVEICCSPRLGKCEVTLMPWLSKGKEKQKNEHERAPYRR